MLSRNVFFHVGTLYVFHLQIYGNSMKWQIFHTNTCEDIFLYVFFINLFQCLRHLGYGNQAGIERGMIIP